MKSKTRFLPYLEARDFVQSLGIKSQVEWNKYCEKDRAHNVPSNPSVYYKNNGWVSWMDWLDTNNKQYGNIKYTVNDDYFKKFSCNMAYILGFWFADGYIGKSNYSYIFSITQDQSDKYLLEAILKEMDSNNYLYKWKNCCVFKICSKPIYSDIIKMGGKERKSLDVRFPKIPKKYLPDFIRGLWDGDGSIYYNKQIKSYVSSYSSSSKGFINKLYYVLKKNIAGICKTKTIYSRRRKRHNISYNLQLGKGDTIRLKKFMYQEPLRDKLMLKRKYDLFLKMPDDCFRTKHHKFLNYNDSKNFINSIGFESQREWRRYCSDGKRPRNIPSCPYSVYKNSGWVDWATWLGKTKQSQVTTA